VIRRNSIRQEFGRSDAPHETESIYRRYAIVDEAMLQAAAEKLSAFQKRQTKVKASKKFVRIAKDA
jgi:hypothetical protein